jgi:hypothetical protein
MPLRLAHTVLLFVGFVGEGRRFWHGYSSASLAFRKFEQSPEQRHYLRPNSHFGFPKIKCADCNTDVDAEGPGGKMELISERVLDVVRCGETVSFPERDKTSR